MYKEIIAMKIFRKLFSTLSNICPNNSKARKFIQKLETKPDEFISAAARHRRNLDNEMIGIEFSEIKKVKFFDEDIEKMKNMTQKERVAYKSQLKRSGRYTYEE